MNYVSSIVHKYGDEESVKRDAKTILEIIGRQGIPLLLDVIAESCGETANKRPAMQTSNRRGEFNISARTIADILTVLEYVLESEREDFEEQCEEHEVPLECCLDYVDKMNHVYAYALRARSALT